MICEQVDRALDKYTQFSADCPDNLCEAMRYCLLAPGKRLRPRLVLLAAELCGATAVDALPAACAVEMIHAYSLIHDDLPAMDDDDLRRGQPTCHKKFDEATAILAGDALQALAFQVLAQEIRPAETAARCCAELAQAVGAESLVGGQAADLAGEHIAGGDEVSLRSIHRRKTGALITVSLRLGASVAGAGGEQMDALTTYGNCLGLAFQITDDLLDATGEQASMGKRVGKDSRRGKRTYPTLLGVEESRQLVRRQTEEAEEAIELFCDRAAPLIELARFVVERDH